MHGDLRHVDEAFDPIGHGHEGTERHGLDDLALDDRADLVIGREDLPRILERLANRERDALAIEVDLEHLDGDLVADLDDLRWMVHVLPGQLRDVHEPVHASEIHEGPEVDDRRHDTLANLPLGEIVEERLTLLRLLLFEIGAA